MDTLVSIILLIFFSGLLARAYKMKTEEQASLLNPRLEGKRIHCDTKESFPPSPLQDLVYV